MNKIVVVYFFILILNINKEIVLIFMDEYKNNLKKFYIKQSHFFYINSIINNFIINFGTYTKFFVMK